MLESHNDVAVAIAEHIGGSVEGFATMMNDKARSLGCLNTNFVTPNGLDAEGHYTTARDLAVIASYAIKNERFVEITNTPSYKFEEITKKRGFTVTNKDRFLYMMEGAIGVKTGFTNDAGYCFVGAIKNLDKTLISVVLGCGWPPNKSYKWMDTRKIMTYGIDNYEKRRVYNNVSLNPMYVKAGKKKTEKLEIKDDLYLLMREDEKVYIDYDLPKDLKDPVKADIIIGHINCYVDGVLCTETPVYTTEMIEKKDFKFCFKLISGMWTIQ
jgi:D-alanyl-D-alanine carboxypeptidase (penicillin-binding protein 5/6)